MSFTISFELWTIVTAGAAVTAAVACLVIASRINRALAILERQNATLSQLRSNLGGVATVVRSQEDSMHAAREAEEARAEKLLLDEETTG